MAANCKAARNPRLPNKDRKITFMDGPTWEIVNKMVAVRNLMKEDEVYADTVVEVPKRIKRLKALDEDKRMLHKHEVVLQEALTKAPDCRRRLVEGCGELKVLLEPIQEILKPKQELLEPEISPKKLLLYKEAQEIMEEAETYLANSA